MRLAPVVVAVAACRAPGRPGAAVPLAVAPAPLSEPPRAPAPAPGPRPEPPPAVVSSTTPDPPRATLVGDRDHLYWRESDGIVRTDPQGDGRVELAHVHALAFAVAGDELAYTTGEHGTVLSTVPVAGGRSTRVADGIDGFAADGAGLVWTAQGKLWRRPTGATVDVVPGGDQTGATGAVALDGDSVYLAVRDREGAGAIVRLPRAGGASELIVRLEDGAGDVDALAVTRGHACWRDALGLACARRGEPAKRYTTPSRGWLVASEGLVLMVEPYAHGLVAIDEDDHGRLLSLPPAGGWLDATLVGHDLVVRQRHVGGSGVSGVRIARTAAAAVPGAVLVPVFPPPEGGVLAATARAVYGVEGAVGENQLVEVSPDGTRRIIATHSAIVELRVLEDAVAYATLDESVEGDLDHDPTATTTIWLARSAGRPRRLCTRATWVADLTLTRDGVYWIEDNGVWRVALAGGRPHRLAAIDLSGGGALLMDRGRLYLRRRDGAVFRVGPHGRVTMLVQPLATGEDARFLDALDSPPPDMVSAGTGLYLLVPWAIGRVPFTGGPVADVVDVPALATAAGRSPDADLSPVSLFADHGRVFLVAEDPASDDPGWLVYEIDARSARPQVRYAVPAAWGPPAVIAGGASLYVTADHVPWVLRL